jgi:DNA-binding NarL/FixJ family response regulator
MYRKHLSLVEEQNDKAKDVEIAMKPLGSVWIDCPYPVTSLGLKQILEGKARVYAGREFPEGDDPSLIILCPEDGVESLLEGMQRARGTNPNTPVIVFGLHLDLPLAHAALRAGSRGFIHSGMTSEQIIHALNVVKEGEIAAPRKLLEYLIAKDESASRNLDALSTRQREILEHVGEGLSNAEIAKKLFLSESTIKQHLRAVYKLLGIHNRTEAANLIRNSD